MGSSQLHRRLTSTNYHLAETTLYLTYNVVTTVWHTTRGPLNQHTSILNLMTLTKDSTNQVCSNPFGPLESFSLSLIDTIETPSDGEIEELEIDIDEDVDDVDGEDSDLF